VDSLNGISRLKNSANYSSQNLSILSLRGYVLIYTKNKARTIEPQCVSWNPVWRSNVHRSEAMFRMVIFRVRGELLWSG